MNSLNSLRVMATILMAYLLIACGSAPIVRSQPIVGVHPVKVSRIFFFYQDATMSVKRISGTGNLTVSADETGIRQFGDAMVARVTPAFQKSGVTVAHAAVVPPGE
jgi:hypothetical protein